MFEHIVLEPEQERLLLDLVEAFRKLPRTDRRPFYAIATMGSKGVGILHPGFGKDADFRAYEGDIEELGRQGLLNLTYQQHSIKFDISPVGFRYYEVLQERLGTPFQRVVEVARRHLDDQRFRGRFPGAFEKWQAAEALVWAADSQQQLTAIGHHCREALQEFAHALVLERDPASSPEDKPQVIHRLRSLLDEQRARLGSAVAEYLTAALAYWGTVHDLTQRQEHGASKDGQQLTWEDGRRVVVGTLIVMTELAAAIPRRGAT